MEQVIKKYPSNFEDLTGKKFGRLTVIKKSKKRTSNTTKWICKCECGNIIETDRTNLIKGQSKSCGCLAKELLIKRTKKYNLFEIENDIVIGYTSNTNKQFKIDKDDYEKIKNYCWCENKDNYMVARIDNKRVLLHRYILNFPEEMIDHINRDKSDNRKQNLRFVNYNQNNANKNMQSNNKSGIVGVRFDKVRNKWVAELSFEGKTHFKRFNTLEEAIAQRKIMEEKYFGEYQTADVTTNRQYSSRL